MLPNPTKAPRKHQAPVVILTGGGSGGHITPLLSLVHALKAQNPKCKVIYIGLKGEKLEGLHARYKAFDQVYFVPAGKFRRYHGQSLVAHLADFKTLSLNTRDLFRVVRGLHSAEKLIKRLRPDLVFSKGGYVAVPVGIAAQLHGVPIITHDSDSVPGLANRIVGRWAKVRTVGMPADHQRYPKNNTVYTGIPVDERIKPVTRSLQKGYKRQLGIPPDVPVLLSAGGGQGSEQINNLMFAIVPQLFAQSPELRIIHITGGSLRGQTSSEEMSRKYKALLSDKDYNRLKVLSFTSDFYKYSGAADLIITRAGASAMAEFALQAKACIVIPNSALAGGHQLKNSEQLKNAKLAEVLPGDVSSGELLKATLQLLADEPRRAVLASKLGLTARPRAAEELAKIILAQTKDN